MKKNVNKSFGILFATVLGLSVFAVPTAHAAGFTTVTISSQKEKDHFAEKFIDKKGNIKLAELTKFVEEQTGLGDCKITDVKKAKDSNTYVVKFERNKLEYDFTTDGKSGMITNIKDIVPEKPNHNDNYFDDDWFDDDKFENDDWFDDDRYDDDDDDDDDDRDDD